jgi:hypothetical protein
MRACWGGAVKRRDKARLLAPRALVGLKLDQHIDREDVGRGPQPSAPALVRLGLPRANPPIGQMPSRLAKLGAPRKLRIAAAGTVGSLLDVAILVGTRGLPRRCPCGVPGRQSGSEAKKRVTEWPRSPCGG